MKTIDFCMVTWPRAAERLEYLEKSLASFRQYAQAPRHKIEIYVSAETVGVSTENFLACGEICNRNRAKLTWRHFPPSLGGNQNDALMLGYGEFKLLSQDDWAWQAAHDLSDDADFLERHPEFSLTRYAAYYTEFDPTPLYRQGISEPRYMKAVKMDGPYVYGDQPHLRRADFATRKSETGGDPIGFYAQSATGDYSTPEHQYAARLQKHGWKIAAYNPNVVEHIGTLSSCPTRQKAAVS